MRKLSFLFAALIATQAHAQTPCERAAHFYTVVAQGKEGGLTRAEAKQSAIDGHPSVVDRATLLAAIDTVYDNDLPAVEVSARAYDYCARGPM